MSIIEKTIDVYVIDGERYVREEQAKELVKEAYSASLKDLRQQSIKEAETDGEFETAIGIIDTKDGRVITIKQLISDVRLPQNVWREIGELLIHNADQAEAMDEKKHKEIH